MSSIEEEKVVSVCAGPSEPIIKSGPRLKLSQQMTPDRHSRSQSLIEESDDDSVSSEVVLFDSR